MESLAINISNLVFIVVLWSFFIILIRVFRIRKLRVEQQKVIRKNFPELSNKEFRKRKTELFNYERVYLTSTPKRIFQEASSVLIVVSLVAPMFNSKIPLMFLGCTFIFIGFFSLSLPSQKEQKIFWGNYLKENPDNPIRAYPKENPEIDSLVRKTIKWWLILGIGLVIVQILIME